MENLKIIYIENNFNYPYTIKKKFANNDTKRINKLSKNDKIFNKSVTIYQEYLRKSNFKHKLKHKEYKKLTM